MADPSPGIALAVTTGKEALKILNEWIDSRETVTNWYGECKKDFVTYGNWYNPGHVIRNIYHKFNPRIGYVFTIRREDWQLVITEALPVAHTWFRAKRDYQGECSWLPLYRLCKDRLPRAERDGVLMKADSAVSTLGIVYSLPAARLDLWGLVVMAYANGATAEVRHVPNGGFIAKLLAKNFVLSISQASVSAHLIGKLEPKEHPEDKEPLGVDDAKALLDHGHSFSIRDVFLGWPINGDLSDEPPQDLVNGHRNKQLERVVLDYFQTEELKKRLRDAIVKYRRDWVSLICEPKSSEETDIRDISSDLLELEGHQLRARKPQISREQRGAGGFLRRHSTSFLENIGGWLYPETLCFRFPERRRRNMIRLWELIDIQLLHLKLLLCDGVNLVDNMDHHDAIETLEKGGELLVKSTSYCEKHPEVEHKTEGMVIAKTLHELLRKHNIVLAMARMLWLSETVDQILSTRDTGTTVLLG